MPATLAVPFKALTLEQARTLIKLAIQRLHGRVNALPRSASGIGWVDMPLIEPHLISLAFVNGDHWQAGYGWIGPRPSPLDDGFEFTMTEIARAFVSKNVIGEIAWRHVNGVVGIEPAWGFASRAAVPKDKEPPPEITSAIAEVDAALTPWWDSRRMHELLQRATITLLCAERAMLRLYIPRGMLQDEAYTDASGKPQTRKVVKASTFEEALDLIWVDHPMPEQSALACDEDTREYVGVVIFRTRAPGMDPVQGNAAGPERAEVTYLEGDVARPLTVIKSIDGAASIEVKIDLGGRLPMYEMERPLFITPQLWQQQRSLNLSKSMAPRTVVTAGFLERTILNAQMPGTWEQDERGNKTRFVPAPYITGPGTTTSLVGVETKDQDGNPTLATPSINYRDPVPVTPLIEATRAEYSDMLEEGSQEHTLAYTNTHASGKTHEQARADFVTSLGTTRSRLEPMGQWLLETLTTMAETLSGSTGKYTKPLRATFACRLDTGPVAADERTALDASVAAGTISRETAMQRAGIVDTAAELERLQNEPGHGLDVIVRQATALQALTASGATLEAAAELVGIDPVIAKKLAGDGVPPTDPKTGNPIQQ